MKIFKYLFILTIISFTSCDDVFDRQPLDKISEADVWNDDALIKAYVTNLYSRYPSFAFTVGTWNNYTDLATTVIGNRVAMPMGLIDRDSESGIGYWDYTIIRDCFLFLQNVGKSTVSDIILHQLEGEVRFILANVYFEMQKRYGGVPLVTEVIDPFGEIDKKFTQRSTEEAIADFIEGELDKAIDLLSDEPVPKGRINKWTAYALKARAMLWNASIAKYGSVQANGLVGIPQSRANEYYTKASEAAEKVISSGKYSLYNKYPNDKSENYRMLFVDEENSEVIFEEVFNGLEKGHDWDIWNLPPQVTPRGATLDPSLEFLLGYENIDGSDNQPEFGPENLYDDGFDVFKNKDPRLHGTVFLQGDEWADITVQTYEGIDPSVTPDPGAIISNPREDYMGIPSVGLDSRKLLASDNSTNSGFLLKKYCDESKINPAKGQSETNWLIFRLAEMYLTKAEAEFELGHLDIASTALNYTRERAGISLVNASTITLDRVRTERRSELAFEYNRYWDLKRWRTAENVLNFNMQGLQIIFHYESGKYYFIPFYAEDYIRVFRPEHYYNPITNSRISDNPDLIQNPGY